MSFETYILVVKVMFFSDFNKSYHCAYYERYNLYKSGYKPIV